METRKGVIEKKEESSGTNTKGPWIRVCFTIDGKKYSTFDKALADQFTLSDYVEMTGEQAGQFWNMSGMKKIDGQPQSQLEAQKAASTPPQEKRQENLPMMIDLLRKILNEVGNVVSELKIMNNKEE